MTNGTAPENEDIDAAPAGELLGVSTRQALRCTGGFDVKRSPAPHKRPELVFRRCRSMPSASRQRQPPSQAEELAYISPAGGFPEPKPAGAPMAPPGGDPSEEYEPIGPETIEQPPLYDDQPGPGPAEPRPFDPDVERIITPNKTVRAPAAPMSTVRTWLG